MEAFLLKLYALVQPYYPIFGGTALHALFAKQTQIENQAVGKTVVGWLILILISIGLGAYAGILATVYYDLHPELEVSKNVIISCQIGGASIGFSGVVWFLTKLKEWAEDAKDAVLNKYSNKRQSRRNEYRDPYEREYPSQRGYDEEDR